MPPRPDSAVVVTAGRGAGRKTRPAARARSARRLTSIGLFLLPALVLYALLVIVPIFQAIRYSGYQWNGLSPLEDFVGLDNFTARLRGRRVPRRAATQRDHHRALAPRAAAVRARGGAPGQRAYEGPRAVARAVLRPVRPVGGHHRRHLQPDAAARRADRPVARAAGAGGAHRGLARRLEPRPLHRLRGGVVEVLRLPHDPLHRRPAADPPRAGGGRGDRRRAPVSDLPARHAAAARPDDPHLRVPVDHRRDAAVRPRVGAHRRRARQRVQHDGRLHDRLGVQALPVRLRQRGGRDPARPSRSCSRCSTSATSCGATSRAP